MHKATEMQRLGICAINAFNIHHHLTNISHACRHSSSVQLGAQTGMLWKLQATLTYTDHAKWNAASLSKCAKSRIQLSIITTGFSKSSNVEGQDTSSSTVSILHTCPETFTERADWIEQVCQWLSATNQYTATRMSWGKDHEKSGCHEWPRPSTSLDLSCRELKQCRRVSARVPRLPVAWSRNLQSLSAEIYNKYKGSSKITLRYQQ